MTKNWTDFFGAKRVTVVVDRGDKADQLWREFVARWLQEIREQSERTHTSYRSAVQKFCEWATWAIGSDFSFSEVNVDVANSFADWLRNEGKAINHDPPTGGEAPWEAAGFDPETAPAWMRWEAPDGRVILRRQEQDDTGEVEVTERGGLLDSSVNVALAAMRNLYASARRYEKKSSEGLTLRLWPQTRVNPFSPSAVERKQPPQKKILPPQGPPRDPGGRQAAVELLGAIDDLE
jgi:hypothetical protein